MDTRHLVLRRGPRLRAPSGRRRSAGRAAQLPGCYPRL